VLLQVHSHHLLFSQLTLLFLLRSHLQRLWANRLTFLILYPQDATLLRREFPQHDLFNDPIFATSECVEFEAAVTAAVGAARDEDGCSPEGAPCGLR
jgi:hypothetical protein